MSNYQKPPESKVWLKTTEEIVTSLLEDEAKGLAILLDQQKTLTQLISKSRFRLALINRLHNKEN